jgi:very-short-patch-repair endonuclease
MNVRDMTKKKKKSDKQKIKELQERIWNIRHKEAIQKNRKTERIAKKFAGELKENATAAEKKFYSIAKKKNLYLQFQFPIYIKDGNYIDKFYIADFCDRKHKMIFEIDGEYHLSVSQSQIDEERTRRLNGLGYQVFRISNEDVFAGKTTAFLRSAYLRIGIDILKIKTD